MDGFGEYYHLHLSFQDSFAHQLSRTFILNFSVNSTLLNRSILSHIDSFRKSPSFTPNLLLNHIHHPTPPLIMKTSFISTFASAMVLLPSMTFANPIKRQVAPVIFANDLANAVQAWQLDTAIVSSFLNNAATITNDLAFREAAVVAFNAENNELTHKAIIDQVFFNTSPIIQNAHNTLVNLGTFNQVVQGLADLVANGVADVGKITGINSNRCLAVLPAIDAYFGVVEQSLMASPQGLTALIPVGGAFRPRACIPATK
jgi:hypothetical protein